MDAFDRKVRLHIYHFFVQRGRASTIAEAEAAFFETRHSRPLLAYVGLKRPAKTRSNQRPYKGYAERMPIWPRRLSGSSSQPTWTDAIICNLS